jgi:molecular chaperone GrpE
MVNDEKEVKQPDSTSNESSNIDMKKSFKEKLAKQQDEISKLQKDLEHWKNEYYKAYADMANLRKTIEKDQSEAYKYRIEGFAQNLLQVLDAFDMALKQESTNEVVRNYLIGFQYVYKQLVNILTDEGIVEIEPKIGDKFDEKDMHAVDTIDDDGEPNIVKKVSLKGYRLHEHLIRPAMVVVSKKPSKVKEDGEKKDDNKDVKDAEVK